MGTLEQRTITGLAQFVVFAALLLFVPAWSLSYWQAWLFLFVFTACSALITLYVWRYDRALLERRMNAGPRAEPQRVQKVIQTFASLSMLTLFVFPALDYRFGWSHVPTSIVIAANILIAIGFFIVFLVFRENTYSAATVEIAPGQTVVWTGPYAIVRHPMYAGALLLLLAMPVALGSWWGLLLFFPVLVVIAWRLSEEEKFLVINLPGYAEYRGKVRYRLVPFLW